MEKGSRFVDLTRIQIFNLNNKQVDMWPNLFFAGQPDMIWLTRDKTPFKKKKTFFWIKK